jgi:hypothetical protein
MSNKLYTQMNWLLFVLAAAAGTGRVPFTYGFRWVAVVYVAALISLPCLASPLRTGWKIAASGAYFITSSILLNWIISAATSSADASSAAILLAGVNVAISRLLVRDKAFNTAYAGQNLSMIYVLLLWIFLQRNGIASTFAFSSSQSYDARFLFWPPFIASALWARGVLVRRSDLTQLFLAIALIQPGIGFSDLYSVWHVPWALWGLAYAESLAPASEFGR